MDRRFRARVGFVSALQPPCPPIPGFAGADRATRCENSHRRFMPVMCLRRMLVVMLRGMRHIGEHSRVVGGTGRMSGCVMEKPFALDPLPLLTAFRRAV